MTSGNRHRPYLLLRWLDVRTCGITLGPDDPRKTAAAWAPSPLEVPPAPHRHR